jgi:hypothetical protein
MSICLCTGIAQAAQTKAAKLSPALKLESKSMTPIEGETTFEAALQSKHIVIGKVLVENPKEDPTDEIPEPAKGTVVWVKDASGDRVLDLTSVLPRFYPHKVYSNESKGLLFLILEFGIEGPAHEYAIVFTKDAGETWQRAADLKRPPFTFPPGDIEEFLMDDRGRGKATFKIDASMLPAKSDAVKHGNEVVYVVTTNDFGMHWNYQQRPWAISALVEIKEAAPTPPQKSPQTTPAKK